ncbi:MAG: T9SS type A sorting domain-containing protein [Candidatus Latescibacteria bacterium]|nr:T9SS type A sorting domain-containing protein [Candidatus Latescibacterota bacterium]
MKLVMYLSSKVIGDYETYIAKDLVAYIDSHYRTFAHRYARGITGFSMGGYGAMHLALKYPEVFGAVVAQAGFYDSNSDYSKKLAQEAAAANPQNWQEFWELTGLQGSFAFAATVAPNPDKPPFFMDLAFEWIDGQAQVVPAVWARHLEADIVHGHLGRYLNQPLRLSGIKFVHGRRDINIPVSEAHALDEAMNERDIDHVYVEHEAGHLFSWKESLPFLSVLLRPELVPLREHFLSAEIQLVPMVVGRPTPVKATLVLDAPLESVGAYQQLYLDLSAPLGSTAEIPLQDEGDGRYTLNYTLTPLQVGQHTLPVVVKTSQGEQYKLIISAAFSVFPAEDLLVLGDALATDWQAESTDGADLLRFVDTGPSYQGSSVSAFQVQLGKSTGWSVKLVPDQPVKVFGYTSLHFAFHPGDAKSGTTYLNINTHSGKTPVKLVSGSGKALVDMEAKTWQVVGISLDSLHLNEAIESLEFTGKLEGTFYLDDLRLVTGAPPPVPTAVLEDRAASLPQRFSLSQNFPNPFNSSTVIRFELPQSREVELAIYNLAGQKVATLLAGEREAGAYTLRWDGKDDSGKELASGVYLYRLQGGGKVETRKLLLVR